MNIKIIYAHPYEGSYNRAILENTLAGLKEAGHTVDLLDLCKEDFNPVMRVEDLEAISRQTVADPKVLEYQGRIEKANHLVIIFPVWFECMPAILKGYFDKVFSNGWAYKSVEGKRQPVGQLTHLNATVISTMGMPKFVYNLFFNNALKGVLVKGVLKYSGVQKVKWFKLGGVQTVSNEKRTKWLHEIYSYMKNLE
jgi:putative NADPH-quinone reductase